MQFIEDFGGFILHNVLPHCFYTVSKMVLSTTPPMKMKWIRQDKNIHTLTGNLNQDSNSETPQDTLRCKQKLDYINSS